MILDTKLSFTAGPLAITTSKVLVVIDAKAVRDFGRGQPMYLNVWLDTIFTSAANGLTLQIISSSGADPGSGDVFNTIFGPRLASAMQVTGYIYQAPWPDGVPYERVSLYALATTALAAGKIDAFFTIGVGNDVIQIS